MNRLTLAGPPMFMNTIAAMGHNALVPYPLQAVQLMRMLLTSRTVRNECKIEVQHFVQASGRSQLTRYHQQQ